MTARPLKTLSAFATSPRSVHHDRTRRASHRPVRVVGGSYFEVMGLRPYSADCWAPDDGPKARGGRSDIPVLDDVARQRTVSSRQEREARRPAGHHCRRARAVGAISGGDGDPRECRHQSTNLDATMVTGRVHRMTELFGRLAPGVDPRCRPGGAAHRSWGDRRSTRKRTRRRLIPYRFCRLRDQIVSPARTVLLVLLAASALCS